jgi:hypothetical protein
MFLKLLNLWSSYKFEFIVVSCIIFIIIMAIYYFITGKRGTWKPFNYNIFFDKSKKYDLQPKGNHQSRDSKGEIECRRVLEKIFNRPFNKSRPNFLRNNVTGGMFNLELDCFNENLRLAVEYNGRQHYDYIPYFHKSKEAFHNQKYRDFMKQTLCRDNRITLIEVPYSVDISNIESYLIKELRRKGYKV